MEHFQPSREDSNKNGLTTQQRQIAKEFIAVNSYRSNDLPTISQQDQNVSLTMDYFEENFGFRPDTSESFYAAMAGLELALDTIERVLDRPINNLDNLRIVISIIREQFASVAPDELQVPH